MRKQYKSDIDISGNKDFLTDLKQIDFELAYLALLTKEGLKPLSRWEKPLDARELNLLEKTGLLTKQITRLVKSGSKIHEIIFSRSPAYIELYANKFENKPIDKSTETQQFEGFLFGYPSCCIEQYIQKSYAENNLDKKSRKYCSTGHVTIVKSHLFYWTHTKRCLIYSKIFNFHNFL